MQDDRRLVRAAGSMSLMTALSRIAGYVRDNLQAGLLGAASSSDAFVIAFRIPNLLRRMVAEGALTAAFVPAFTHHLKGDDRAALWRFAGSMLYVMTFVLTAIVVLGIGLSPVLVRGLAWGFSLEPAKLQLTISLTRWLFPYIFFVSLAALASAILNAFERFALPAFTPVLLNLSIIACASLLSGRFANPAYAFAVGVLVGGIAQLAVQLPSVMRRGLSLRIPRPFDLSGVREVASLMIPRALGAGITQINLLVDSQFASTLRPGTVSYLYYAVRVTELTLGMFAISLSTVLLPRLSRASAAGDRATVRATLGTASRLLVFVTVPASVGLVLLREPIIHTLFERGRFSADDTAFTAAALGYYALGLLPFAAISILATVFFAHRDTRTPLLVGAATFVLHLGLNFALREPLEHRGIALSTSGSAMVDAALLAWLLRRRYGAVFDHALGASVMRTCACAAVMGLVVQAALTHIEFRALAGIASKSLHLAGLVIGGALVYLVLARLARSDELRLLTDSLLGGDVTP